MDSRLDQEFEEYAYRVYISDSLQIAFNLNTRYIDLVQLDDTEEEDGDEIVRRTMEQAGLRFEE